MTDVNHPVNPVRIGAGDLAWRAVIDECVVCGERHIHGGDDEALARGGRSHRVAHCDPSERSEYGYYLELAEDADPPADWRRLEVENG